MCVYVCGWRWRWWGIQSAEAEIGQMMTVRFKEFACPLQLLSEEAFPPLFVAVTLLDYQENSWLDIDSILYLFIHYASYLFCALCIAS